ncbi:hypothetical protein FKG94_07015 [Exilibacterium tricleocarpae]|uniref:Uncharacterized protein n=1 Tax=Exilibacterium tricleocarpae TaxID=2591008 RepID=A0A545TZ38_9GAMM|nr:hypothetical protein [Exilibacterium tricleocarpae]TQV82485.1 hypothetical protein FKG94_07015 [Exilibacterium tricleocarpae]
MKINLHIERLVVSGIDIKPNRTKELKLAVESALMRKLVDHGGAIQSRGNCGTLDGGLVSGSATGTPANLGNQIGRAVYRGIGK